MESPRRSEGGGGDGCQGAAGRMSKEAEMSIAVSALFPGFRFSPTDLELICYYLGRKIDGDEKSVEVIAEVEIYKFEPWDLPAQSVIKSENEWFFFCARGRKYPHGSQSRRATEQGYWKATGKERNVKSGSRVVGTKRTLVFHMGRAPRGERTEWIMHEYRMIDGSQDALVVCRLRRNAEFRASSSQRQTQDVQCVTSGGVTDQTGASEGDKTVESCSASESEQKLSNDVAESSTHPEDPTDDDCYADILNDDIIKLDQPSLSATTEPPHQQRKGSQALKSNPTPQETIYAEASPNCDVIRKPESSRKRESEGTMRRLLGLFHSGRINRRSLRTSFTVLALLVLIVSVLSSPLVSLIWPAVPDQN